MEASNNRPRYQASVESRLMAERLGKAAAGELVTYGQLSEIIGQDVRLPRNIGRLHSARRMVLNDRGLVFAAVANEGLKRLTDGDLASLGAANRERTLRASRRTQKQMGCVDLAKLTAEQLQEWNIQATLVSFTIEVLSPRSVKAITQSVSTSQQQLPVAKAIEAAFGSSKK